MIRTVNKTVLDNGIRIVTRRIPQVRSVSMGVWVNVGSRDETPAESGLSHFIEHMIFKGTTRRSAYDIAKEFDAVGGNTNAFTSMEITCYHARVMDAHLDTMIDILSDIFLNSVFDPEEVERERPVILQEIGMVEDSPEDYVHILAGTTFWGDDPLGRSILGSRENILAFDADAIRSFFHRCYRPDRIVISAAGNLFHDRFVEAVAPLFSGTASGNGIPARQAPIGRSGVDAHAKPLEQTHICLTTPAVSNLDPRRYAFSLMNTLLGGNMSSRLFQEIRERRGLAYSVYSFLSSFADTGAFGVYAGVDPETAETTVALILKEIRRLRSEPVTTAELRDAKEYTKGSLLLASESVENQMVRLAQNEIHFNRYVPLREILDEVEKVTPEEITTVAEAFFRPETMALTLLGPQTDMNRYTALLQAS